MADATVNERRGPWTREERAEFALNMWRGLFNPAQFDAAVQQVANQIVCHLEYDLLPDDARLKDIQERRADAAVVTERKGWMHAQVPTWGDVDHLLLLLNRSTISEKKFSWLNGC